MKQTEPKRIPVPANGQKRHIRVTSFQAVTFFDQTQQRQIIMVYALGTDGIVREYRGPEQGWLAVPIYE